MGEQKLDEYTFEALSKDYERRLSLLVKQQKVFFNKAESLFAKKKTEFDGFCKRRSEMLERARTERNKEITASFQEVKKALDEKVEALNDPSERLRTMIRWLQETGEKQFLKVADMLESRAGQIVESINLSLSEAPQVKWDNFYLMCKSFRPMPVEIYRMYFGGMASRLGMIKRWIGWMTWE